MQVAPSVLDTFHPAVAEWFRQSLGRPTRVQSLGWPAIHQGKSALLLAPTGSGKTLAAFLAGLQRLMWTPAVDPASRCRLLYVSPLKALAVDVERNLRAPLVGITEVAKSRSVPTQPIAIEVRTGDTPASSRARFARHPADILITTPESLYLLLTSKARQTLASVDTIIIDEIHSLVPTKRGSHLFLSVERLEDLRRSRTKRPLQRIGLSATQRPVEEVARLLGGYDRRSKPRPVEVIDAGRRKHFDLAVEVPDIDMGRTGDDIPSGNAAMPARSTIWPLIHQRMVELIGQHTTTMVFVNSRRIAERSAAALNEMAGKPVALAHHGSISKDKREQIEDQLKAGTIPSLVATSSLELGIDMGAIDLVVQVEAPPTIASGMQRIGRACHGVGGVPKGVIMAKHRGDLLAAAAAVTAMREGAIEEMFFPRNPLDVLAQQLVAMSCDGPVTVSELFATVRRAAPFADLPRNVFDGVLDMLAGKYPSDEMSELRPRVTWDRVAGTIQARDSAKRIAVVSGGTIPDRGLYGVFVGSQGDQDDKAPRRVGELDEEMVFELRVGEVFLLGASSWRAESITHDRVLVSPAPGEPGKMPFWHGDRPGRSREFGKRIGALTRVVSRLPQETAEQLLQTDYALNPHASRNLVAYVHEQMSAAGEVPSDEVISVERYVDDVGDWRVCVLTPFGTAVHAPWAIAVKDVLERRYAGADLHYTDDGMVFRIPACDEPPPLDLFFLPSADVESIVTRLLGNTSVFASRFRECASRALLLPRRSAAHRTPLWAQRKRAGDLLAVASRYPSFPIVLEAYRECLRDVFDVPGLVQIMRDVETRTIRPTVVDSRIPSPFAANVLFSFVANFLYLADAPVAERRAQALSIDHAQLRQILGDADMRELIDPAVIDQVVRSIQRLDFAPRHADDLHDLLLWLGDLSLSEIEARLQDKSLAATFLSQLERTRQVFRTRIAGQQRIVASEDAARVRDALGVVVPSSLPSAYLEPVEHPIEDLVSRYARTHGPFLPSDVATRFGVGVASVAGAIESLLHSGRIVQGAFLPAGSSQEYCDAQVLRALRTKTLAALRKQVEPVEPVVLARFLCEWHCVTKPRRGPNALLQAVAQLEGCPLLASSLEADILPARIAHFAPWDLDALCAAGEVFWAGVEPVGPSDGRVVLFSADHEALLARPPGHATGSIAAQVRQCLQQTGAAFFRQIVQQVGGFPRDVLEALWDLVWAGEVTNDTLEPLRSRMRQATSDKRKARAPRSAYSGLPGSEGRWSLRRPTSGASDTDRMVARCRALMDRYGIVTREVAKAESMEGGFSTIYPVLKRMEEAGKVLRGYFVAGRGGAQFALPGADERLRNLRDISEPTTAVVLASADPANPYGSLIDWPQPSSHATQGVSRPQRSTGSLVVLQDGILLGWLSKTEQSLLTFLPEEESARAQAARGLVSALVAWMTARGRKALFIPRIDGHPAAESPIAPHFLDAGFHGGAQGLMRRADSPAGTHHAGG